jgi:hypothetical protein
MTSEVAAEEASHDDDICTDKLIEEDCTQSERSKKFKVYLLATTVTIAGRRRTLPEKIHSQSP